MRLGIHSEHDCATVEGGNAVHTTSCWHLRHVADVAGDHFIFGIGFQVIRLSTIALNNENSSLRRLIFVGIRVRSPNQNEWLVVTTRIDAEGRARDVKDHFKRLEIDAKGRVIGKSLSVSSVVQDKFI